MRKTPAILVVLFLGISLFPWAEAQKLDDKILKERRTIQTVSTEAEILLDGKLDEAEWELAPAATDFIQAEPREGWSATEKTEVRILHDDENLYFGVRCFDTGAITVNDLRQDFGLDSSDSFGIVIDSFHDQNNGTLFYTNPAGARRDSQFVNEGRIEDVNWDGVWYVVTGRTPEGWTAEIRIPFKTLRFTGETSQTWGINFNRRVRRKNETAFWSFLPRRYNLNRVSLAGRLVGLESMEPSRNFKVKPYVKSSFKKPSREADTDFTAGTGADIKYGLGAGMTLDVTVHPDFSEVETDTTRINLTRFGIFFPEKRDFFLENSGIFHFGDGSLELGPDQDKYTRLFYSRRIGLSATGQPIPILAGARLTGQIGKFSIGALDMQTGEEGSQPSENFSATRVKWNLFGNSEIGAAFVNRQADGPDLWNRAMGVDANFRFFRNLSITSFLAKTSSPKVEGKDWARKLSIEWRDNFMRAQVYHYEIGENFRPEVGYVQRPGTEYSRTFLEFYPRPPRNRFIREFSPHFQTRYVTDPHGRVLSKEYHAGYLEIRFQNGATFEFAQDWLFERLDQVFRIRPEVPIAPGDYKYSDLHYEFASDRSRQLSGNITLKRGHLYDGPWKNWSGGLRFQAAGRLTTDFTFSGDSAKLKRGTFKTNVAGLKTSFAFNTKTFLDVFVQYNSDRKAATSNVRFRWMHHPLSDLILVYNEERGTGTSTALNRSIILKYTHLLDF